MIYKKEEEKETNKLKKETLSNHQILETINSDIPVELQIVDYNVKQNYPIVKNISLTSQSNIEHSFSTNIIIISLEYIDTNNKKYNWEIRQTYKLFKEMTKFCESRLPERKKTINHTLNNFEKEEKLKKEKTLSPNYLDIFYKVYNLSFSKIKELPKNDLINFIQLILKSFLFNFYTVKEFFEISDHSFIQSNNGIKPKEGLITKQAEYSICQSTIIDMCHCIKCFCYTGNNKYWFLLKNDMICFLDSSRSDIGKGIFWFDNETKIEKRKEKLILRNSMKKIKLTFKEEFQRNLWYSEIDWRIKQFKDNFTEDKFESFVLEKSNCKCKWFIDGKDYFEDLQKRLLKSRETVFMTDWWMSPELFLIRPINCNNYKKLKYGEIIKETNSNNLSRLCDILNYISKKGVKIYILLYCEVSLAISLNSKHTKLFLSQLSPNIKIIRHPKKSFDLLWSHHEKLVIIDQEYAYVGGLDLCWGRYDTNEHIIVEKENNDEIYNFPFIDYCNARINDFSNVAEYLIENVNRKNKVKMPWHDIHSLIQGPVVLDIARHFIERWNFSKSKESSEGISDIRTQYSKKMTYNVSFFKNWLSDAIIKIQLKNGLQNLSENVKNDGNKLNEKKKSLHKKNSLFNVNKKDFSFKKIIEKKKNEQNEDLNDINIEINNNNKNEDNEDNEINTNKKIDKNFYRDITENKNYINDKEKEEMNFDSIPFQNQELIENDYIQKKKVDYLSLFKAGMKKKLKKEITKNKNKEIKPKLSTEINLNVYNIEFLSTESKMKCQCLRSLSYWSGGLKKTECSILKGYYYLIENSKHFIYIENQFFISKSFTDEEWEERGKKVSNLIINEIALKIRERIIKAHKNNEKFKVIIFIPLLPGFSGSPINSSTLQIILKYTYKTISRNDGLSLKEKLKELLYKTNENLFKEYISFFSLRNHSILNNIPVTELIYIHSKLMIVDDKKVILGSANINDRSMIGERDSEFAIIFSDKNEEENSLMNNKPYKCSSFAKSLRVNLLREHLGLKKGDKDYNIVMDPLNDNFWKFINERAKNNTDLYRDLFKCYPDDTMIYFDDIPNEKEKEILIEKYQFIKKFIIGHIVQFPMDFLKKEILERSLFSAEILVPIKNFV